MGEFEKTGVVTLKDLEGRIPPAERLKKGPVAVLECVQEIPCDPCVHACPFKAITMESLISTPRIDFDRCTGCALCLRVCPGLAIFIIDERHAPEGRVWITIPYEFIPIPKAGDDARALNRRGEDIGPAKVVRVVPMRKREKTTLVTFEVDRELAMEARALRF